MSKTTTFAAWAVREYGGDLRVDISGGLYVREPTAWAMSEDGDDGEPVRVRVTVEILEDPAP